MIDVDNQAAEVARVAALIVLHGSALGARYSAGLYTPAVPCRFLFAVLNRQGAPVMLAHDAFEVARWLVGLEAGTVADVGLERPIEMPTDDDMAAAETVDRRRSWSWLFDAISAPRAAGPESRLRAPDDDGYDRRCRHCAQAAPHTNREHFAAKLRG